MPIAALVGSIFSLLVVSLIVSVILQLLFKRADKRNLNTIAVLIAVMLPLLTGQMENFVVNLLGAIPVWFAVDYLLRRYSTRPDVAAKEPIGSPRS